MHSLLYLFYLILPTIIIYPCTTAASYHLRRYELPNLVFYDEHQYAVNNITMELIIPYQGNYYDYYAQRYKVKVSFSQPRELSELQRLYPNYKLLFRLWEASIDTPAIFHSEEFIDTNLENGEFSLEDVSAGRPYFIRIFTITDSISETLSSIKFFRIKRPYQFDQNSENRIFTYDNQYAPRMDLKVENKNLNYGYGLRLALYNHGLQRYVKAFRLDIEKNSVVINSTILDARNTPILRYAIPYRKKDEYVIRVTSVLNSNMIASEYSISKYFVIP